ncbi:protein suppressor of hairy wing isoform X7 [Patella vulgata]|uniref:protein suppressor of hairy wing isoform X7 n=1 Tax=Patella vulgata TaxID=6465 RepID=UPI00217F2F79|nr:protein suppressor of hairy wing isoform X7 [Patella vulgata]
MEIKQEVEGFRKEFEIFCAQFHENLIKCGKVATVMTLKQEEELTKYLLTPQDETGSSSTEIASWLENNVFCLVSNEDESHYELHIWNDTQRKVVSIENYFTVLNSMFAETGNISHDKFLKKVNEKYALIPEEVVKYFINNVTKKPKFKVTVQNKENKVYGCKVISYEYLKKRVVKKRILTEIFDKSNGKVLQSRCHEEDPLEEDVFYVEKTEKLSDITNTKFTEVSSTTYSSNQALEIKYLGKTSVAYLPPGEINNQDHLVALSNVIYSVNDFPENTGDIQLEFVIPQKQPTKVFSEIESLLSLIEKTDSGSKPTEPKTLVKTPKKNTDTKTRPNMVITPPGKLAIVANPKTRGATLKHLFNEPLISESKIPSYSELNAAAATDIVETAMEEDDDNDDDDDDDDNGHDFLENVDDLFEDSAAPEVPAQVSKSVPPDNKSPAVKQQLGNKLKETNVIDKGPTDEQDGNKLKRPNPDEQSQTEPLCKQLKTQNSGDKPDAASHQRTINEQASNDQENKKELTQEEQEILKKIKLEERQKLLVCDICNKTSTDLYAAKRHRKIHDRPEYKCSVCSKTYNSKSGLEYHITKMHKSRNDQYCEHCDKKFQNTHLLRQHVKKTHLKIFRRKFPCKICDRIFTSYSGCRNHIEGTHKVPAAGKGDKELKSTTCELCDKKFQHYRVLKIHMKLHECNICPKIFQSVAEANLHKKSEHANELAIICQFCEKHLLNKKKLSQHLELHRSASYRECSVCFEYFEDEDLLEKHCKKHMFPEFPFKCEHCKKTFVLRKDLDAHVPVAHPALISLQ